MPSPMSTVVPKYIELVYCPSVSYIFALPLFRETHAYRITVVSERVIFFYISFQFFVNEEVVHVINLN